MEVSCEKVSDTPCEKDIKTDNWGKIDMKEALLYQMLPTGNVKCALCARRCAIAPGKRGYCGVRENRNGVLYSLVYGKTCAWAVDPIEKKPFYHFFPGSASFSFSTVGCNFRCPWCFPPGTSIVKDDGITSIEEIFKNGKKEYQFDGGESVIIDKNSVPTHTGDSFSIVRAFKHGYNGDLVVIKPYYLPEIRCTPNHKLFVATSEGDGGICKINASEISMNNYLVVPKRYKFHNLDKIDLKEILVADEEKKYRKKTKITKEILAEIIKMKKMGRSSKEMGKKFGLHPTYVRKLSSKIIKEGIPDSLFYGDNDIVEKDGKIKFKTEKRPFIPRFIKLNKDLARLFGYFCAEGHVCKDKRRPNSFELEFSFGKKEFDKVYEVKNLIEKIFGIKARIQRHRTNIAVGVGKSSVALLFKILCGDGALRKRVPNVIFKARKNVIMEFISAYISGDGSIKKDAIVASSVSKELTLGIFWLLLKIGILPSFYTRKVKAKGRIENRTVNQSEKLYTLQITPKRFRKLFDKRIKQIDPNNRKGQKFLEDDKFYYIPILKISKENYSGDVYNLEVEKNHSYLANFVSVGNCQNWEISQPAQIFGEDLPPKTIVEMAKGYGAQGIAYTYTEPTVFFEYAKDTAELARKEGLYNVFVSNGYMTDEAIEEASKFLDAIRIDLKAFNPETYRKYLAADIEVVKRNIAEFNKRMHTEVITLLIPTINDGNDEIRELCEWLKSVDPSIPLHFTAYYPAHKFTIPPTPVETLQRARKIALDVGLQYVYTGNVPGDPGENTYCPNCDITLIERYGFSVTKNRIEDGKCPACGQKIKIVTKLPWMK